MRFVVKYDMDNLMLNIQLRDTDYGRITSKEKFSQALKIMNWIHECFVRYMKRNGFEQDNDGRDIVEVFEDIADSELNDGPPVESDYGWVKED